MKTGRDFNDLAAEVFRQNYEKRDFIADTRLLEMVPMLPVTPHQPGNVKLRIDNGPPGGTITLAVADTTHSQIAETLKIPAKYYYMMLNEAPDLLAKNVNRWLQDKPKQRMIRTLDNRARAFLSNRYRRLDNHDLLATAALPVLDQHPDLQIKSCQITDDRFYLKLVTPRIQGEVRKGDIVQAGISIMNSEVGKGLLRIDPLILTLVCDNGMIAEDRSGHSFGLKKYHTGRPLGAGEEAAAELLTDEAIEAENRAFWLAARDIIAGALDEAIFKQILGNLKEATEKQITGDTVSAVKELANTFQLTEAEEAGIRDQLFQHEEPTQYGMLNAVTRYSQQVENYDRATELEQIGGKIINLNPSEWKTIAEAAA